MRYVLPDVNGTPGFLEREFDVTYQTMEIPEGDNQSIIPKTATATITGNPFKAS